MIEVPFRFPKCDKKGLRTAVPSWHPLRAFLQHPQATCRKPAHHPARGCVSGVDCASRTVSVLARRRMTTYIYAYAPPSYFHTLWNQINVPEDAPQPLPCLTTKQYVLICRWRKGERSWCSKMAAQLKLALECLACTILEVDCCL